MNDDPLLESQMRSLRPDPALTRRLFAASSLGVGFALAAQPVTAQTIVTTDTGGLVAGDVEVQAADRKIPAYRAYPQGKPHAPVVLVVHEIFGVHEHIRDLCRRLAKQGYYAICSDLYVRYGDATKVADMQVLMSTIVAKAVEPQVKSDLDATVRFAGSERANTDKLAVTGFCWGGRVTWLYTAANPAVKAGVAWYGPLTAPIAGGRSPVAAADRIKGRVLGLYGGKDNGIPLDQVDTMRAALVGAGDRQSNIVVYPDAPHGFNADYRPSYRKETAEDAWTKMLNWFQARGVA